MRIARGVEAEDNGMGLTPLIDVVFLLLIFFIVATSFNEPRLSLELPAAETAAMSEPVEAVRVEIRNSGEIVVDGETTTLLDLDSLFAKRAGDVDVVELRAELAVPHGSVVEVLDRARAHGLTEVSIAVEPRAGPAPANP
ncbi:MAG: biopolymer transporter ExbD [Myxococcota bacterium]